MSSKTNSNFPETHQSKADLQRIYREKEADGFAELQDVIRQVTDGRIDPASVMKHLRKLHRKLESSVFRMNSCANSSTEYLIRKVVRHGQEELGLVSVHRGITSTLCSILNITRIMLRHQTQTSGEGTRTRQGRLSD
ncbi:hypothetical protein BDR07DRAFT_477239 [Suillus spraguei]|nr:hypothetical protein BDR07DRAFT_477239 [Suillus spraguei]